MPSSTCDLNYDDFHVAANVLDFGGGQIVLINKRISRAGALIFLPVKRHLIPPEIFLTDNLAMQMSVRYERSKDE